jgi:hypothetical protein
MGKSEKKSKRYARLMLLGAVVAGNRISAPDRNVNLH